MIEPIGIREARAQLSRLARRARRGDSEILTLRGQPIAKIGPVDEDDKSPEDRIEDLKRRRSVEDSAVAPVPLPALEMEPDLAQRFLREDRESRKRRRVEALSPP